MTCGFDKQRLQVAVARNGVLVGGDLIERLSEDRQEPFSGPMSDGNSCVNA